MVEDSLECESPDVPGRELDHLPPGSLATARDSRAAHARSLYGMAAIFHTGAMSVRRRVGAVVVAVALGVVVAAPATAAGDVKDPYTALDRSMRARVRTDDLAGGVVL